MIYCRSGIISEDAAAELRENGFSAVNLVGGYVQWLQRKIRRETTGEKAAEIEQSLRKKFHRVIFSRFAKAGQLPLCELAGSEHLATQAIHFPQV